MGGRRVEACVEVFYKILKNFSPPPFLKNSNPLPSTPSLPTLLGPLHRHPRVGSPSIFLSRWNQRASLAQGPSPAAITGAMQIPWKPTMFRVLLQTGQNQRLPQTGLLHPGPSSLRGGSWGSTKGTFQGHLDAPVEHALVDCGEAPRCRPLFRPLDGLRGRLRWGWEPIR